MREPRPHWIDNPNPDKVAASLVLRALVIVGIVAAVSALIWGAKVALSDPIGQGNAIRKVNDSGNQLAQQAYFEKTYQDILAADRAIDVPGTATERQGRTLYCIGLVADYDAAARKQIAAKFRAVDLPAQIDTLAPATDCKETPK